MSKSVQAICIGLLSAILIVQIITLFTQSRAKTLVVRPMQTKAMSRNIDGETQFNNDYYNGFGGGGESTTMRVLDENGNCLPGGC